MTEKFCPHCGAAAAQKFIGGRERPACPVCGYVRFGRFSLGAGGLLELNGRVLLVQRGEEPGLGRWTLPGGYVEEDETPNEAVVREVREETGLQVRAGDLLSVRNSIRADDQNVYYVFRVELIGPETITVDGTETLRAGFFAPEEFATLGADLAPYTRWVAAHHATPGLRRLSNEAQLKPLSGQRWVIFSTGE